MALVIQQVNKETGEKETLESMIKRFKKKVLNEGLMAELKNREYYKAKSLKRREKSKAAQRRLRKAQSVNKNYND